MESKKERKQKKGTLVFPELGNQNEEKFLEELISCLLKKVKSGKHQVKVARVSKILGAALRTFYLVSAD